MPGQVIFPPIFPPIISSVYGVGGLPPTIPTTPALPDWWEIDSLDVADIIGAWSFDWRGFQGRSDALVDFVHGLAFAVEAGNPTLRIGEGLNFGGSGNIKTPLPEVDIAALSVVMQFHNYQQNGTLDAFYSHFIASSHYTLQHRGSTGQIRWSCGDGDSPTQEWENEAVEAAVYATTGTHFYKDGTLLTPELPDSGPVVSSGLDFRLGCIFVDSGLTQYSKFVANKLLIVSRLLTAEEVAELTQNMQGA